MKTTSQITFLYFDDFQAGCSFVEEVLQLKLALDQKWAKVYQVTKGAFIGVVKAEAGSIESGRKGGTLISLTVPDARKEYQRLSDLAVEAMTDLKTFDDIGLESFFFKGPEGYDFEIQTFTDPDKQKIF